MNSGTAVLTTLSPLDGRYYYATQSLQPFFSEFALNSYRLHFEISYLIFFADQVLNKPFTAAQVATLEKIGADFNETEALKLQKIERDIKHDVKAVEYYLRQQLAAKKLPHSAYVHFGLTSEDTNSVAYALMLKDGIDTVVLLALTEIIQELADQAEKYADTPMLARTHGQPAVPTTFGKELITYAIRLHNQVGQLKIRPHPAKITGAIGTHSALTTAFPDIDWLETFSKLITSLNLNPEHFTTQIIPGEHYAQTFDIMQRINTILIDLNQDCWRYISDDVLVQQVVTGEIGSSTMPQKVNPIQFENSEGNLGLANALLHFFSQKLPISRLQRDLSDSTVKRNFGAAFGYCLIGYQQCLNGLTSVTPDTDVMEQHVDTHWECLTEAVQTILKQAGDDDAYQKIKNRVRGKTLDKTGYFNLINQLDTDTKTHKRLLALSPLTYLGHAKQLVIIGVTQIKEQYGSTT
ncbi:MAG: adenylosuccinate lyase [Patescibacteria group bacterium]